MRWVTITLLLLTVLVQGEIWLGSTGLPNVVRLNAELSAQQLQNNQARERNALLAAEVRDLRDGLEIVEEKARLELGMVKSNEILVQVTRPATGR